MVVMVVVGGPPLSREKSRDVLEQPPPILAKARRLQLADASFRDWRSLTWHATYVVFLLTEASTPILLN